MKQNIILSALFVLFIFSNATEANNEAKPKFITASYFEHPSMPPFITFIKKVYAENNIDLTAIPMPASRGLFELDKGTVDVDIVRPLSFAKTYENLIIIHPAIYQGEVVLLCNKSVNCNKAALADPSNSIMATRAVQSTLPKNSVKAKLLNYENLITTLTMLKEGKIDYVVYGTTRTLKDELAKDYNIMTLKHVALHHVINQKYKDLVPAIEASIKKYLPDFKPDSF